MELSTAKQLAYQARHTATDDATRIKQLTEAVEALVQIVEEHENTIRKMKVGVRQRET